jgi:hypothetical protein
MSQQILYLNSDHITSGTTSKGILKYGNQIDNNIHYELDEFIMNNNLYNVNDNNNKVYFDEGGGNLTATLTNGFYYPTDFATELKTQLDSAGGDTYTVTYSSITGKLTIGSTGTFGFQFASNTSNTARYLLGLEKVDQPIASSQLSGVLDLAPHKALFIKFDDDSNKHIKGSDYFVATFVISNEKSFGDVVRYKKNNNYSQYIKFSSSGSLHFRFINDKNQDVNLNNAQWIMILRRKENKKVN